MRHMSNTAHSSIVSVLFILLALSIASAQSTGELTLSSSAGCVILAQVATLGEPYVITRMKPICAEATETITWPLTNDGNGAGSSMAFYGNVEDGLPACVLGLTQMQAMYLLGRTVEWRGSDIWDHTQNGPMADPITWEPLTCSPGSAFLPPGISLPDTSISPEDTVWSQAIELLPASQGTEQTTTIEVLPGTTSSSQIAEPTSVSASSDEQGPAASDTVNTESQASDSTIASTIPDDNVSTMVSTLLEPASTAVEVTSAAVESSKISPEPLPTSSTSTVETEVATVSATALATDAVEVISTAVDSTLISSESLSGSTGSPVETDLFTMSATAETAYTTDGTSVVLEATSITSNSLSTAIEPTVLAVQSSTASASVPYGAPSSPIPAPSYGGSASTTQIVATTTPSNSLRQFTSISSKTQVSSMSISVEQIEASSKAESTSSTESIRPVPTVQSQPLRSKTYTVSDSYTKITDALSSTTEARVQSSPIIVGADSTISTISAISPHSSQAAFTRSSSIARSASSSHPPILQSTHESPSSSSSSRRQATIVQSTITALGSSDINTSSTPRHHLSASSAARLSSATRSRSTSLSASATSSASASISKSQSPGQWSTLTTQNPRTSSSERGASTAVAASRSSDISDWEQSSPTSAALTHSSRGTSKTQTKASSLTGPSRQAYTTTSDRLPLSSTTSRQTTEQSTTRRDVEPSTLSSTSAEFAFTIGTEVIGQFQPAPTSFVQERNYVRAPRDERYLVVLAPEAEMLSAVGGIARAGFDKRQAIGSPVTSARHQVPTDMKPVHNVSTDGRQAAQHARSRRPVTMPNQNDCRGTPCEGVIDSELPVSGLHGPPSEVHEFNESPKSTWASGRRSRVRRPASSG